MNNIEYQSILKLVEAKFGRGPCRNWKNRDFEDLNFEISKKTKTNISAHTLKRIFGKIKTDDYYLPQKATIQALKQYINYDKNELLKNEVQTSGPDTEPAPTQKRSNKNYKIRLLFIIVIILSTCLTAVYLYKTKNPGRLKSGTVRLTSAEGRIPKSVQFEYTTPNNTDSFSICYDGNFEAVYVPNGEKMKSSYYYQYPGLFRVRMWYKKQIVSPSIPVYVQTKGWEAYGNYSGQKQMERFFHFNLKKCLDNGTFSPTKKVISNVGLDTTRLTEITLNNYHPTGINGDNFKLKALLKNPDEWPGATCNSVYLIITGKKEYIQLHFANPGCSYWIHCRISEKRLDKRNENLKNFTFDLSKWQNFHVENKDKHIRIFVNNILRYTTSYTESIGEIMGVTIKFQGNGYLKEYSLSDLTGKEIFKF